MKHWFLLVLLGIGGVAGAQEGVTRAQNGQMRRFSVPLFDAKGRATRKLSGDEASFGSTVRLREAIVSFLDPSERDDAVLAQLFLDEALFVQKEQIVTGVGQLLYRSAEGNISGKGYRYEVASDRFTIRDGFRIEMPEGTIEGREADVKLVRIDDKPVIEAFEARGKIVFTPKNPEEFKVERAESERAWYAAADGLLNVASPVRQTYKGVPSTSEFETLQYKLKLKR